MDTRLFGKNCVEKLAVVAKCFPGLVLLRMATSNGNLRKEFP